MIARDAGWTLKPGLEVYNKDGHEVGCIDQASAQGWMQVEALSLGLQRLRIPHGLSKSVDGWVGARPSSCEIETPLNPSLVIGG